MSDMVDAVARALHAAESKWAAELDLVRDPYDGDVRVYYRVLAREAIAAMEGDGGSAI